MTCSALCLFLILASALGDDARPVVYTTFYPTTWMTERMGGDLVEVICPVPADADPIFWKPSREQVAAYQAADLIVVNGAKFEQWVEMAELPMGTVARTARGFKDQWIEFDEGMTHSHGPEGNHTHKGIDGHTWMDPLLAKQQAREILTRLERLLPEDAEALRDRFQALATELDGLHEALRALGSPAAGEALVASHPAYNYLARRMGWEIVSLDFDPEEMPTEEQFADARRQLEAKGFWYRVILWEAAPTAEIARATEEQLGVKSVEFAPCEMMSGDDRAAGADYLSVMRENIARLRPFFGSLERAGGGEDGGGDGS